MKVPKEEGRVFTEAKGLAVVASKVHGDVIPVNGLEQVFVLRLDTLDHG